LGGLFRGLFTLEELANKVLTTFLFCSDGEPGAPDSIIFGSFVEEIGLEKLRYVLCGIAEDFYVRRHDVSKSSLCSLEEL